MKGSVSLRIQAYARYRHPKIIQRSQTRADGYWRRKAQSTAVNIRLDFMALLSQIEIRLRSYEDGGDVVERVLLLLSVVLGQSLGNTHSQIGDV